MALKTSSSEELPSINMTPMIDVVFLLIIFFMVGTQFNQEERQIDIKLPGVNSLGPMIRQPQRKDVVIQPGGAVYFEGQQLSLNELKGRLSEMCRRYPDLAVGVRADMEAKQKDVLPVCFAIRDAGVVNQVVVGLQNERLR